jgi:2,4-dienoyl-CoA reductase-like NADH-dependent reductase (Old Yellow Enzyme family)
MTTLFSPIKIREVELRNRIVVSPMCEYSSEDGFANDWHLVHLGSRAVGGAGLVMTEATSISPEGRITDADLGIWKDEHIEFLKRITTFIHASGAVAGIQLAHAGRKASKSAPWKGDKQIFPETGGWLPVGPSPVAFSEKDTTPEELTIARIEAIIDAFAAAAVRAHKAGFKVLEIHAAHGYLINEFLSPLSNFRSDNYGGSFENRVRFLISVVVRIRAVWPKGYPVFVRISATDWKEGGWTPEDSVSLALVLKDKGVDLIDCSSGGLIPHVTIPAGPGYQVLFAARIKKESGLITGAVGLITKARQAEEILKNEEADLIFLAREFLRNPYFPLTAAAELGEDMQWPVQYERAKPHG